MTDTKTPDEIEREIERERAQLGSAVDELQDRFSPDRIMRELGRGLSDHGQDIGEAVTQSVKRNPVALALTGIGLAWLMSGRSWEEDKQAVMPSGTSKPRRDVGSPAPRDRYADTGVPARDHDVVKMGDTVDVPVGYGASQGPADEDWLWADDDTYWDDIEDDFDDGYASDGPGFAERLSEAGDHVSAKAGNAADSVKSGAASMRDGVAGTAASVRDGVADRAASVRDGVQSARNSADARARRIRRRLSKGTESLTEQARERVIAARWAAVKARRATADRAKAGADTASRFFDENPLVVGGLALAAGAILAGSLPRTKQEDAYFGEYSDRAYDKAQRTFMAEREKALKVADRAAETAQEVLADERAKIDSQAPGDKSAAEHVADEVRDGAARVADAAKKEAEKQQLGKPVT